MRDLPPIHPGEQLREEFMKPLGITAYRLAKDIGVPVTRVQAIVAERRGITGGYSLAVGAVFRHLPGILAQHATRLRAGDGGGGVGARLETEVKPRAA
jgi:addiction module HigA family antidote